MSILSLNLKLVETNAAIAQSIAQALLPDITKYFNNIYNQVKNSIPKIVIAAIKNEPEYSSLISGKLKAEFGLPDSNSRLEGILSAVENNLIIQFKPPKISGSQIKGGIKLQMVKSNFSDLLSLAESSFITENGSVLNWLQWLLIEGDNVIVSDYRFIAGPYSTSRTGMGIMNEFSGAFWRVPPEFSGNINNNWITRAIDKASGNISQELDKIISRI